VGDKTTSLFSVQLQRKERRDEQVDKWNFVTETTPLVEHFWAGPTTGFQRSRDSGRFNISELSRTAMRICGNHFRFFFSINLSHAFSSSVYAGCGVKMLAKGLRQRGARSEPGFGCDRGHGSVGIQQQSTDMSHPNAITFRTKTLIQSSSRNRKRL
jgi:hypothetical protein